jgi:hypothetical protein
MPSYKITIHRTSVIHVDAASPQHIMNLLQMMPVPVLDMTVEEVKSTTETLSDDQKGRWVYLDGKITLTPIKVPDRAALKLVAGTYQNDLAVVAEKDAFVFLRGASVTVKPDLLGALVPHVMIGEHILAPFDPNHMIESTGGVWASQAIMSAKN